MKQTKQLADITRRLFKARTGVAYEQILHPKRDWIIGVSIGIGIICLITAWSAYTYIANRDGGAAESELPIANSSYNAALVEQALGIFADRAAQFSELNSIAAPQITEPEPEVVISTTTASSSDSQSEELVNDTEATSTEERATESAVSPSGPGESGVAPELSL